MLTLTNADLIASFESLAEQTLKADSGTDTTLVCSKFENYQPDVTGNLLIFLDEDNFGQEFYIDSYDEGTFTATLSGTLLVSVTSHTKFTLMLVGYHNFIERSEAIMNEQFRNAGIDMALFDDPAQLKEMHICKTIEMICTSKMRDGDSNDLFYVNRPYFASCYDAIFTTLKADYDGDENVSTGQVVLIK